MANDERLKDCNAYFCLRFTIDNSLFTMNIGFDAKRAYHNKTGLGHYSRTLIHSLVYSDSSAIGSSGLYKTGMLLGLPQKEFEYDYCCYKCKLMKSKII